MSQQLSNEHKDKLRVIISDHVSKLVAEKRQQENHQAEKQAAEKSQIDQIHQDLDSLFN